MQKSIVAAAFVLMLLVSGRAHASGSGYVCYVEYLPAASSYYGNSGEVSVGLYSGPNCTGSYVLYAMFPSAGATACAPGLSETAMLAMLQNLRTAQGAGQNVWISTSAASCGGGVDFYAH